MPWSSVKHILLSYTSHSRCNWHKNLPNNGYFDHRQNTILPIADVAVTKRRQTILRNLDFFTCTTIQEISKVVTRKVCHAIHLRNLMRFCAIIMPLSVINAPWVSYSIYKFSCKRLRRFPGCAGKKIRDLGPIVVGVSLWQFLLLEHRTG